MSVKFISQDLATLHEALQMRKEEYEALYSAGKWQGAVVQAGFLLELALKIAICKNLGEQNLPRIFQVHDLELLLFCSGLGQTFKSKPALQRNFTVVLTNWSPELRYEKSLITKKKSDDVHQALFDPSHGLLTFLATI
ncbi:MAG: hypothetical protein AAB354_06465 [candidate division KSB1 bacterium]